MIRIEANIPFMEPPQWAILEHSLIDLMNVDLVMELMYVRTAPYCGRPIETLAVSTVWTMLTRVSTTGHFFICWMAAIIFWNIPTVPGRVSPGSSPATIPATAPYGRQGIRAGVRLDAPR